MSFSEIDVDRRTKKGSFLRQIDFLIDWSALDVQIRQFYAPQNDVIGRPSYSGLLLFKMLLVGIWYGGLSDEAVEDISNSNLHVMRFLKLSLEDNVPDHSVLSRFRTALTKQNAWDSLLNHINNQLSNMGALVEKGYHVDASITHSQRKPKKKPTYEIASERSEMDDEPFAKEAMEVTKVEERGVDSEARWVKKGGKFHFGFKQHTLVTQDGLVKSVITTPANTHDSVPFECLVNKNTLNKGKRLCGDKGYASKKHDELLKKMGLKNGIQTKAKKGQPLSGKQKQRNALITKIRFVVERTFGSQALWFAGKNLRYIGLAKAHAWHTMLAVAYNLKRLPKLFAMNFSMPLQQNCIQILEK